MPDDFNSRARRIQPFVLAKMEHLTCLGRPDSQEAKITAPVVVPKDWDMEFPRQLEMAVRLTGMVLRDMQMVVYLGRGNPNQGFSIEPFQYVADDHERPEGMEHARYLGHVKWEGALLDMPRIEQRSKMAAPASNARRTWQIKKYLQDIEDEKNGKG
jgi:hypothetical protein